MTTKDYVYLGLILLASLAFYCNGFYAGVYKCKRMYDSVFDDSDQANPGPDGVKFLAEEDKVLAGDRAHRDPKVLISSRDLKGDFGKN
jgi:hypothetical protein